MKIKTVEFAGAVAQPGGPRPGTLPQIAFAGRSNVGKSSLINRLLGRTRAKVARVSSTPGKTQEINFYRVRVELQDAEREFFLVDLPGYGYARAPLSVRERWRPLIESYLGSAPELIGVVQLIDVRHALTAQDRQMLAYLAALRVPILVVLTKSDKLAPTQLAVSTRALRRELGIDEEQVVTFSARTGHGRDELLDSIAGLLDAGISPG